MKDLPSFAKDMSMRWAKFGFNFRTEDPELRRLVNELDRAFKELHNRINDLNGLDGEHQITSGGFTFTWRNGILVTKV